MSFVSSITRRTRLLPALAIGALAITPAAASASTSWFGSSLDHTPANAGSTCAEDGVSGPLDTCTHVGSYYPGFSGRAQARVTGTITQLRIEPEGPMQFVAKVVTLRHVSSDHKHAQAVATAHSRQITLAGPTQDEMDNSDYPINTVNVKLKVKKGQYIAIDTTSNTAEYCSDGTPGQLLFDPPLMGSSFHNSNGVDGCLMLVQARISH
jgi:hypothetical protein